MPFPKFTLLIARAPVKPIINCPANEPSVHKTEFKNALKSSDLPTLLYNFQVL